MSVLTGLGWQPRRRGFHHIKIPGVCPDDVDNLDTLIIEKGSSIT
ncbi:Uncharacterized protein dnm_064950 [Desulfonema magnum]|uniref:Uncharacterized protein n=1 Tax=Desulfonema magnum TaxID=45655 RepID=A0A975GR01_9BACT|nr:Uncharacterized protein dnm_064950 [Desulfonema magnum]